MAAGRIKGENMNKDEICVYINRTDTSQIPEEKLTSISEKGLFQALKNLDLCGIKVYFGIMYYFWSRDCIDFEKIKKISKMNEEDFQKGLNNLILNGFIKKDINDNFIFNDVLED